MSDPTPARLLTPGLTPRQTDRLREHLTRLTAMPGASSIYIDADRAAGRWLVSPHAVDHPPARCTIAAIAADYPAATLDVVGFIVGFAHGIRIGRTFAPPAPPRSKRWISEDYRQLTDAGRRDASRYIRKLLKVERRILERPKQTAAPAAVEAAAARRWAQTAGKSARMPRTARLTG